MIKPLHDRLLVRRFEAETVSEGGIIIPDDSQEKPCEGEVIAVGKGNTGVDGERIPMDVKVGDIVIFSKYAGTEIGDDILLSEGNILAIKDAD
jgi:chaperonin GroES